MQPTPLPPALGDRFTVSRAAEAAVSQRRLRARDLDKPFRGVRRRGGEVAQIASFDRLGRERSAVEREHILLALAYAQRMGEREFFSHAGDAEVTKADLRAPAALVARVRLALRGFVA